MTTCEEADIGRQEEEIQALSAIYGDDFLAVNEAAKLFDIRIRHEENAWWSMTLQVLLPRNYPSSVPPVFEIHATWLGDSDEFEIRDKLYSIYSENKDELVVFQWVEAVREFMNEKAVEYAETEKPHKADVNQDITEDCREIPTKTYSATESLKSTIVDDLKHDLTSFSIEDDLPEFLHGEAITDRKSTFQAHLVRISSEEEMEVALTELKKTRKIANATHNIIAYRFRKKDSEVVLQDFDDDGEHNAGSRLLHLLQILNVLDYMVVVSRWYGGILLGPDRFKHINNCARNLLKSARVIQDHATKHSQDRKSVV